MLKRLANSGINLGVIIIAAGIFLLSFFALNGWVAVQKPKTITVLAANRNVQIGEVLTSADLMETTIYDDAATASLTVLAENLDEVLGGVAALPLRAGQPIYRDTVIALAGTEYRLSALLAQFPDHSLFPLPLDAGNIVAPEADSFLPGDLIGITVVIGARPPLPQATPTPNAYTYALPQVITTTLPATPPAVEPEMDEAQARTYPPLAKDLFPQGVLVMSIQGLPEYTISDQEADTVNSQPVFAVSPQREQLILLVPNPAREPLALSLQRADQVFISLLVRGGEDEITPGFSYWDFEDLLKDERKQFLNRSVPVVTPGLP